MNGAVKMLKAKYQLKLSDYKTVQVLHQVSLCNLNDPYTTVSEPATLLVISTT